jgi:hypothetical protein
VFGIAIYFLSPARWHGFVRTLCALIQVAMALCLLLFAWLYYVISNGIDTFLKKETGATPMKRSRLF